MTWQEKMAKQGTTYRTAEHAVPLVPALLNMVLQCGGIQRFEQLKTTQQFT